MNCILVGAGQAARFADALRRLPQVRVVAVADEDEAARGSAAELLGASHQAAGLGELLADGPECDGVLVDAPGARLGDAPNRPAARQARVACAAGVLRRRGMCAAWRPNSPPPASVSWLAARCGSCLRNGCSSSASRRAPSAPWACCEPTAGNGGGAAADTGLAAADRCSALSVPYLDLANWLFGTPPDRVYARAAEPGYLQVHLGFSGGGMALIDVSDDLPPGDGYRSVTVIGSDGAGYADDHRNRNLVFGGGRRGRPQSGRGQPGVGGRVGRVRRRQLRRAYAAGCRRRCRRRPAGGRGRRDLGCYRRGAAAQGRPL